ncbi:hypothetical protein SmJEL517_g01345 [Synchytrium microbalum]|uniref:TOG domain-containing protein n=1 Tax=Synchytrium microbalum TaxID=1806994 RepID=A0A507CBF0_9FUNG|nr:uncharacterized protein SmJEL517_g01345 [Synchytrium microbalum]TPX36658.1 hypothetical protein SmJEL517_g01345 [Synchytrium microbalum]
MMTTSGEPAPEEDFSGLSLIEKLNHKSWRARNEGYVELDKLLKTLDLDAESDYRKYTDVVKRIPVDSNLIAQECGLTTLWTFLKYAPLSIAQKTRSVVLPSLIEKGLASARSGTRSKALEITMTYVELEVADGVVDDLIAGLDHKTPKNIAACITALKEAVRLFGVKVVSPKLIVKQLGKIFDHKDKAGFALVIELKRWLGNALDASLSDLKPTQIKEINDMLEKVPTERPVAERHTRSQHGVIGGVPSGGEQSTDTLSLAQNAPEPDPMEFLDAMNILDHLPPNFYTNLVAPKWQDKKEALEALLNLIKGRKLEDGRYHELCGALSKRIADTNIYIVIAAAKCIDNIAKGLRSHFSQYRSIVVERLIDRLKEKKPAVIEALRTALDGVSLSTGIADNLNDLMEGCSNKNPQVKQECLAWLVRLLKASSKPPSKADIKAIAEMAIKACVILDDPIPDIRNVACEVLGTLLKSIGDRAMAPYMERVSDKIKADKIREYGANADVAAGGQSVTQRPSVAMPSASSSARPSTAKSVPLKATKGVSASNSSGNIAGADKKKRPPSAGTKQAAKEMDKEEPTVVSFKLSDDAAETHLVELVGQEVVDQLSDANWKNRLLGAVAILEYVERATMSELEPEGFVRTLGRKPGWKENNFQVMTNMVKTVGTLAKDNANFGRGSASLAIPGLVEKLSDVKIKKLATEALTSIAASTSLQFVLHEAIESLKPQKSPKVLQESLTWMQQALLQFGTTGVATRDIVDFVKSALANKDAQVRTAGVSVLGSLRMFAGPDLRALLTDLSPALLTTIDAEFDKVAALAPPKPTIAAIQQAGTDITESTEDLIPRTDISSQMSTELISEINDANWKTRQEGLDKVLQILESANKKIKPNVGELISALKSRLSDSNKNLTIKALEIIGVLAIAMGKPFDRYARLIGTAIASCTADNKIQVRTAATSALNSISTACKLEPIIPSIGQALAADQPLLRKDLLKWLSDHLEASKDTLPDMHPLVHPILTCLQDRNADVRKLAQLVIAYVSEGVGYNSLVDKAGEIFKGAALASIMPSLEAFKSNGKQHQQSAALASPGTPVKAAPSAPTKRSNLPPPSLKEPAGKLTDKSKRPITAPTAPSATTNLPTRPGTAASTSLASVAEPPILTSDMRAKDQRAQADRGLTKWTFDQPRKDLIEFLAEQCQSQFSAGVHNWLFSTDHYKEKDFILGLAALDDGMGQASAYDLEPEELRERYVANADLILKYLTIRFFDTNTTILLKCLDLLENLVALLDEHGYRLTDYEAASFMPFFINKVGDPKEAMRVRIRNSMRQICRIYPASKMFSYLMKGLESKNVRVRTECLEELGILIQRNGMGVCNTSKVLPPIAAQISDRDASVRNAALGTITQCYLLVGDAVFKHIGKIPDKDRSLLDEKIKRMPVDAASARPRASETTAPDRVSTAEPPVSARPSASTRESPAIASPVIESRSGGGSPIIGTIKREFSLELDKLNMPTLSGSTATASRIAPISRATNHFNKSNPDIAASISTPTPFRNPQPSFSFDLLINQIMASDAPQSIDALKQVEKILTTSADDVINHVDDIVSAITLQIRIAFTAVDISSPNVSRLCKHLVNALVQLFAYPNLAKKLSQSNLMTCVKELLHRLLDPTLQTLEQGSTLAKALNVLVVRILENCDKNDSFSVLLKILDEAATTVLSSKDPQQVHINSKLLELDMKCLWKLTKQTGSMLESKSLAVNKLLRDVNDFLTSTPPNEWKKRAAEKAQSADMPLRTVKTILHELVANLGSSIYEHFDLIQDAKASYAFSYVSKMVDTKPADPSLAKSATTELRTPETRPAPSSILQPSSVRSFIPSSLPHPSHNNHNVPVVEPVANNGSGMSLEEELAAIFHRISEKEKSKEAIKELHAFQLAHPESNHLVEAQLATKNGYFKGYIERGLAGLVAADNAKKARETTTTAPSSRPTSALTTTAVPAQNDEAYSDTLKRLQRMYNRPVGSGAAVMNTPAPPVVAPVPAPVANIPSASGAPLASMQDLMARLEKMKKASTLNK